ncbi:MAG: hypothetical protein WA947_06175 [Phormidesmis sp.]
MTTDAIKVAANYLRQGGEKPNSKAVVAALLAAEKLSKQEKNQYEYEDFLGTWRLGFVSGTQTVRSSPNAKPIKRPGKGRFLPKAVKIEITYSAGALPGFAKSSDSTARVPNVRLNKVSNVVTVGPLQLCLLGPTRFWPNLNALAFDFTNIAVSLGSWTPYQGEIRGGKDSLLNFDQKSLKDQAFFTFFRVEADYIAARGKGGGLALWTR